MWLVVQFTGSPYLATLLHWHTQLQQEGEMEVADLVKEVAILKALSTPLQLAQWLVDVDWHAETRYVLADPVLDQAPDVE